MAPPNEIADPLAYLITVMPNHRNHKIIVINNHGNWENFMIVERLKMRTYNKLYANQYFWRTWKQSEIDLIEERSGKLFGYEMKWKDKNAAPPKEWLEAYPNDTEWQVITPVNALKFLNID